MKCPPDCVMFKIKKFPVNTQCNYRYCLFRYSGEKRFVSKCLFSFTEKPAHSNRINPEVVRAAGTEVNQYPEQNIWFTIFFSYPIWIFMFCNISSLLDMKIKETFHVLSRFVWPSGLVIRKVPCANLAILPTVLNPVSKDSAQRLQTNDGKSRRLRYKESVLKHWSLKCYKTWPLALLQVRCIQFTYTNSVYTSPGCFVLICKTLV